MQKHFPSEAAALIFYEAGRQGSNLRLQSEILVVTGEFLMLFFRRQAGCSPSGQRDLLLQAFSLAK
jgi:hypothetical protein